MAADCTIMIPHYQFHCTVPTVVVSVTRKMTLSEKSSGLNLLGEKL